MEKSIIITVVVTLFIGILWAQSLNMRLTKEKQVAILSDQGMSS